MGARAGAAATAGAAAAAGETVVAAATPPAAGTFLLVFLFVTMIDVNSMLKMVESEVWLHGDVNSMVAAMELGGVVEGGLKLDASKGGETQMVRSTHAAYFNIKLVRQQMVRSTSEACTSRVLGKEEYCMVHT